MSGLPPSLLQCLRARGFETDAQVLDFLEPSLEERPSTVQDLPKAVERLRQAIEREDPIAIYADRDVDGLTGMAILARSLRTLGARVQWGSPVKGRGIERAILERLVQSGARVFILVDCGTAESVEIAWLSAQGIDVIVADHHRMLPERPNAFAWIHPGAAIPSPRSSTGPLPLGEGSSLLGEGETPCGSVMAFKLAEGIWRSYIDPGDPERLRYFLYDHLDLVALGILADRVPLTGENRVLVWHGLRRLAQTRKEGLASLMRFFRLKGPAVSVRQATWQIIPLLNAAGRLGQPQWTADLLLTEDPYTARACVDALLGLNTARRQAQTESLHYFEKTVLEQCLVDQDRVLVATARDLEPSVTGLAAQSLVQKYGRPAFLFVEQGDDFVGSGRGTPDIDLFQWTEKHQELLVKFGGHQGAVGLTVRKSDFPALREGLLKSAEENTSKNKTVKTRAPEASVRLADADSAWWEQMARLEPFGQGFELPAFELTHIEAVCPRSKRSPCKVMLKSGSFQWPAELPENALVPKRLVAVPQPTPKEDFPFLWQLQLE